MTASSASGNFRQVQRFLGTISAWGSISCHHAYPAADSLEHERESVVPLHDDEREVFGAI